MFFCNIIINNSLSFCYIYDVKVSRCNEIIVYFIIFYLTLLALTLYNDYLRYMLVDKIIFYLISSDDIHDSGSIRAWFLFNGFIFVSNNPLGFRPGNSLGLVHSIF